MKECRLGVPALPLDVSITLRARDDMYMLFTTFVKHMHYAVKPKSDYDINHLKFHAPQVQLLCMPLYTISDELFAMIIHDIKYEAAITRIPHELDDDVVDNFKKILADILSKAETCSDAYTMVLLINYLRELETYILLAPEQMEVDKWLFTSIFKELKPAHVVDYSLATVFLIQLLKIMFTSRTLKRSTNYGSYANQILANDTIQNLVVIINYLFNDQQRDHEEILCHLFTFEKMERHAQEHFPVMIDLLVQILCLNTNVGNQVIGKLSSYYQHKLLTNKYAIPLLSCGHKNTSCLLPYERQTHDIDLKFIDNLNSTTIDGRFVYSTISSSSKLLRQQSTFFQNVLLSLNDDGDKKKEEEEEKEKDANTPANTTAIINDPNFTRDEESGKWVYTIQQTGIIEKQNITYAFSTLNKWMTGATVVTTNGIALSHLRELYRCALFFGCNGALAIIAHGITNYLRMYSIDSDTLAEIVNLMTEHRSEYSQQVLATCFIIAVNTNNHIPVSLLLQIIKNEKSS
jgi:hypothetical protein